MDLRNQIIKEKYALYNGDCIQVMAGIPDNSVDMVIYSPPFASMYTYSSSDEDLGNCKNYEEFFIHYNFVVKEIFRILKPGRMACVHCMDIPKNGDMGLDDFPGDIIKLHKNEGFKFWDRKNIWKEPLRVAIRTRQRALMHMQLVNDTLKCRGALADYLLVFKKNGENETPVKKPYGLTEYDGDLSLMNIEEKNEYNMLIDKFNSKDESEKLDHQKNRLSQFIWRRYASASWEDVRANRCLTYKPARDKEDDRHVCPLQIDIITRSIIMYTNENEVVLTPFMGVGSEVFGAIVNNRKAIGIELKESYFNQAIKNIAECDTIYKELDLFRDEEDQEIIEE